MGHALFRVPERNALLSGRGGSEQFLRRPGGPALQIQIADFTNFPGRNRIGVVSPGPADIGQNGGDVRVRHHANGWHCREYVRRLIVLSGNGHGTFETMEQDLDEAVGVSRHPF